MTQRQQKIYNGLLSIGEEIASFYKDALIIKKSELSTKSYLLAHCAREIDAGMRDIFAPKFKIIEKCTSCNSEINKSNESHLDSICRMLDVSTNSLFAKKWKKIAENFPANAHRRGAYKLPRPVDKITEYWEDYENILFELFGYFNSKLRLIERLVKYEIPTEPMLLTLPNFFQNKIVKFEFYKELKSPEWLIPLFEQGFFNPADIENEYPSEDDNKRIITPNWIELYYLLNIGQSNSTNPQVLLSECLNKFVESYITYRDSNGNPIKNSGSDLRLIQLVISLPSSIIKDTYLDFIFQKTDKNSFISYYLIEDFIPKLLEEQAKDVLYKLILFFLEISEISSNSNNIFYENSSSEIVEVDLYRQYDSLLTGNDYLDIFYNKMPVVAQKYGLDLFNLLKEVISKNINQKNEYLYDTNAIPTISVTDDYHYFSNEPFKIIIQTSYKLLYYSASDISDTIYLLFNSKEEIYQRIAIQLLAEKYDEYNTVFWDLPFNLINNRHLDYEFSLFIQNNIDKFSETQIGLLIKIIETYDSDFFHNNENSKEENEKYRSFNVLKFLSLLIPSRSAQVYDKITEYKARSYSELTQEDSDFSNDIKISWSSGDEIPESASTFNEKSIVEIEQILLNFDEKDKFGRSLKNGVYKAFYDDIAESPNKYFPYLERFIGVEESCFNQIINAVEKLANDEKGNFIYWKEALEFIDMWLSKNDYECKSIIRPVLQLIENFTKDDSTAFDIAFMPIAKKILIDFSQVVKPETIDIQNIEHNLLSIDYSRLILAMMSFSLRDARVSKKNQLEKWDIDIKNWIESELEHAPSIDLHSALGLYFSNFDFLSPNWFSLKIDLLLPKNDIYWIATLRTNTLYKNMYSNIYKVLINHGDYQRILSYEGDFAKLELLQDRVIQFVCWFYLAKVIDETSQLGIVQDSKVFLRDIIEKEQPSQIESILKYLIFTWGSKDELQTVDSDFRYLLQQIFEVIERNIDNQEFKIIAGKFNETINLLCNLDEDALKWINFSIKYLNQRGNAERVLAGLKLHSQNNLKQVGEILIEFSKEYHNDRMKLYGLEDLKYVVDLLFSKNYSDMADEICDNFGNRGFQELKVVYDKHHPI